MVDAFAVSTHTNKGFFLSATLHAAVAALLCVWAYLLAPKPTPTTTMFVTLGGIGDNYMATEAPALGTPGGVKLNIPPAPVAKPEPPAAKPEPPAKVEAVAQPEPAPAKPEPAPPPPKAEAVPTPAKAPPKPRTMAQNIRRQVIVADSAAKQQIAKERAAEAKRQQQMTKEAFDAANRAKVASAKTPSASVKKIDAAGIADGVRGGSPANTKGGNGGTALTVPEMSERDAYINTLLQRLKDELDRAVGLDDGLRAEAEFHVLADGRLARGTIIKSSGNEAFDLAVLKAIREVRMPARPKGVDDVLQVPFNTHAK